MRCGATSQERWPSLENYLPQSTLNAESIERSQHVFKVGLVEFAFGALRLEIFREIGPRSARIETLESRATDYLRRRIQGQNTHVMVSTEPPSVTHGEALRGSVA